MTSSIDYKPFFWNDMIDGKHSGGYKVGMKRASSQTSPNQQLVTKNTGTTDFPSGGGGAIVDDNIIERFHNLVVPVGFVLLNENNAPRKYNEHSIIGVVDEAMFNKLFDPWVVNKSNKKRTTKKNYNN